MADFLLRYGEGLEDGSGAAPAWSGLATFISFLIFGAIPLSPYFFLAPTETAFTMSVALTFSALTALGVVRWAVSGQSLLRCVGETVAIGGACAIVAYAVGLAFTL